MTYRVWGILLFFCFIFFPSVSGAQKGGDRTIYQKNSLYQYIAVLEDTHKRERYIVGNKRETKNLLQGGIFLNEPEKLLFEYTQMSFIGLAFLEKEPTRALFVGLGAGSMPRYFNRYYPSVQIDIVEIDPDIHYVAKKYFYFKEKDTMKTHIADGRVFIKRARKKYDMVFLDAYQNDYIPFHLTTVEFLQEVRKILNDNGVVIANIRSPYKNKLFYSMIATYKELFAHLYIFKGQKSRNYIFVATARAEKKDKKSIMEKAKKIQVRKKFDIDLQKICRSFAYSTAYERMAEVLTDDFAPVNLYRYMKVDK